MKNTRRYILISIGIVLGIIILLMLIAYSQPLPQRSTSLTEAEKEHIRQAVRSGVITEKTEPQFQRNLAIEARHPDRVGRALDRSFSGKMKRRWTWLRRTMHGDIPKMLD